MSSGTSALTRVVTIVAGGLLASALIAGCSKSETTEKPNAAVSGPITDAGDTGMKAAPGAKVAMGDPKHGSAIFSQNCSSCHGAGGAGGGIGPKLIGEKSRKNYDAAIAWIKNPMPPMPKLYPAPLNASDVADVAAYVESL